MKKTATLIAFLGMLCLGWSGASLAQLSPYICGGYDIDCDYECYNTGTRFVTHGPFLVLGDCYSAYQGSCPYDDHTCGATFYLTLADCQNEENAHDYNEFTIFGC